MKVSLQKIDESSNNRIKQARRQKKQLHKIKIKVGKEMNSVSIQVEEQERQNYILDYQIKKKCNFCSHIKQLKELSILKYIYFSFKLLLKLKAHYNDKKFILILYKSSIHSCKQFNSVKFIGCTISAIIDTKFNTCQDDKILSFFKQQKQEGLVECIQRSKDDNMIRIYRKVKSVDIQKLFKNKSEYCHCYHGTKFEYLKTILDVGLQPSGAKTKHGTVKTPDSHIAPDITVAGIKNWAKAIFISPSPFYAADAAYSGKIESQNENYRCLVEALIKLGSYKEQSSTVVSRDFNINNEPKNVNYRIDCNQEDQLIQRTEDATQVILFSVLFLKQKYLMNQSNYEECLQFLGNCSAF